MRRLAMLKREEGIAMVLVVLIGAMITLLSVVLIDTVRHESDRSAQQVVSGGSFQAAEAGIDDYVTKLVDDRGYYLHYIHPGESTRREPGGTNVSSGGTQTAWTYGTSWTYPNGKDSWRTLPNGYEYNLRVYPPGASSQYVRVVAAGRKAGSATDVRVLETYIRPSSLADYYRVVNGDVAWGVGATTDGKIYANGNITHDGVATGNLYAEGQITGSVSMQNGAKKYDVDSNPDIRSQVKNPIDFTSFLASFSDIERASQLPGGIYRNDTSWDAWRFTFNAGGTVGVQGCDRTSGNDVADVLPTCGATTTLPVPPNGAIYSVQDAIVQGSVKGRVTVASNDDIIVGNNISFVTSGTDVLGLVAKNNLYVAKYVPDTFSWKAAVIAQNGTWQARPWSSPLKTVMNFTGMSATADGGAFSGMFTTRNYGYDAALLYLPPPWFPIVEDAYTVLFFRELPAAT
jgi:hypothetical protein